LGLCPSPIFDNGNLSAYYAIVKRRKVRNIIAQLRVRLYEVATNKFINFNVLFMKKFFAILLSAVVLTMFVASSTFATVRKTGSQGDYSLKLEIDGVVVAGFKEVSGLESETEIIEIKDGDDMTIRKRPGLTKYSNIILKRGFIDDPALIDWVKEAIKECQQTDTEEIMGIVDTEKHRAPTDIAICDPESLPDTLERKSGSIIFLDRAGQEAMRYNLYGIVPISWKGPALNTEGNAHMVEALELAVERIEFRKTATEPIPITFNFVDGDVKAEVNPESIQVLFNPKEYTVTKAVPWKHHDIQGLDSPTLEFTSGEPYRLQMELFFDRYEENKSVKEYTDKIEKLALVHQELHRPPTTLLTWGTGLALKTTIESCDPPRFTRFLDDGTPVSAVMNCVFKDFSPAEDQLKGNPRH